MRISNSIVYLLLIVKGDLIKIAEVSCVILQGSKTYCCIKLNVILSNSIELLLLLTPRYTLIFQQIIRKDIVQKNIIISNISLGGKD